MSQSTSEPIPSTSSGRRSEASEYQQKPKRQKTQNSNSNSALPSSSQKSIDTLDTPIRNYENIEINDVTPNPTPDQTPSKTDDFLTSTPNYVDLQMTPVGQVLQPPTTPQIVNSEPITQPVICPQEPFYILPIPDQLYHSYASSTAVFVQNSQNQLELHQLPLNSNLGYNPLSLLNQAYIQNGVIQLPQYQPIVLQVPTVDLLQNKLDLSNVLTQSSMNQSTSVEQPAVPTSITETNDVPETAAPDSSTSGQPLSTTAKYRRAKLMKFSYLNNEMPPQEIVSVLS
jgi:hypothetical protein